MNDLLGDWNKMHVYDGESWIPLVLPGNDRTVEVKTMRGRALNACFVDGLWWTDDMQGIIDDGICAWRERSR